MYKFQLWAFTFLLFQGFLLIILLRLGAAMDALNAAVARVQASVAAANAKIDSLKASQVDPAALSSAVSSLGAAADALDAKVAEA